MGSIKFLDWKKAGSKILSSNFLFCHIAFVAIRICNIEFSNCISQIVFLNSISDIHLSNVVDTCTCHIGFVTVHLSHCNWHIAFVLLYLQRCIFHIATVTLHLHLSPYICHIAFVKLYDLLWIWQIIFVTLDRPCCIYWIAIFTLTTYFSPLTMYAWNIHARCG